MSKPNEAYRRPGVELTGNEALGFKSGLGIKLREVQIFPNHGEPPYKAWAQGWLRRTAIKRAAKGRVVTHPYLTEYSEAKERAKAPA